MTMPVCFQLIDRCTGQPAILQDVDRAICQNLDLPFSDTKWAAGWYDYHGFMLALGKSFAEIAEGIVERMPKDDQREDRDWIAWDILALRINHFLLERYESSAWWEPKR